MAFTLKRDEDETTIPLKGNTKAAKENREYFKTLSPGWYATYLTQDIGQPNPETGKYDGYNRADVIITEGTGYIVAVKATSWKKDATGEEIIDKETGEPIPEAFHLKFAKYPDKYLDYVSGKSNNPGVDIGTIRPTEETLDEVMKFIYDHMESGVPVSYRQETVPKSADLRERSAIELYGYDINSETPRRSANLVGQNAWVNITLIGEARPKGCFESERMEAHYGWTTLPADDSKSKYAQTEYLKAVRKFSVQSSRPDITGSTYQEDMQRYRYVLKLP